MPKHIDIDEDLITHLYRDEGKTVKEIAASIGASPATVQRRLRKLGVLRTGSKKRKIDVAVLRRMYIDENMTMQEIADELQVALATTFPFELGK